MSPLAPHAQELVPPDDPDVTPIPAATDTATTHPAAIKMPNGNQLRPVTESELPEGLKIEPNAIPRTEAERMAPWVVFAESAPVYAYHNAVSEPIGEILEGTPIMGTYTTDINTDEDWIATWDEVVGELRYVSRTKVQRVHPANLHEGDLEFGEEIVNRWWALPLTYEASDIVDVPAEWGSGRGDHQLRREARDALVAMFEAAREEGVEIRVTSAYRSGERQKSIYTRRTARDRAQRASAPPGHSEHQLGTTCDLVDDKATYVLTQRFQETPQSAWLEANGARFGFRRSYYPDNTHQTGYISEPWHWRYFGKPATDSTAASTPTAE